MNTNAPLGDDPLNSLPHALPDAVAIAEEQRESTSLENTGNDRLIENDAPETVISSLELAQTPSESVGDPPPIPEAIAHSQHHANPTAINLGNNDLPLGNISGRKWHDVDGDGESDATEPGLPGWTIYLDGNRNGQLDDSERSTVTDEDGNYTFSDLPGGTYTLAEVAQPDWRSSAPSGFPNGVTQLTDNTIGEYEPDISGGNVVWMGSHSYAIREVYLYNGNGIIQLTHNVFDEFSPQISGNNAVWSGTDLTFHNIFLYVYRDGEVVQITDRHSDSRNIQISGNNVVWTAYSGSSSELYLYNGSEVIQLSDNDVEEYVPKISGDRIVWSADDNNDEEIYLYDGSQTLQLTDNQIDDYSVEISGNNIAWLGTDSNNNTNVYIYDGNQIVQLTDSEIAKSNLTLSGNNIAWLGTDSNNNREIYFWDGTQVIQLTDSDTNKSAPQISGNNVVWNEFSGNSSEIYFWDGTQVLQITDNDVSESNLQISANTLVWSASDGNDLEIYFYDGRQTIQLTDNDEDESNVQLSGGNVVWSSFDGNDWEIYAFGQGNIHTVNLEPGETLTNIDFGNWQPITLSGTKWHDLDADGTQDAGEPGLDGWTIYLDTNNNAQLDNGEIATITDSQGNYSFTLPAGTYTVAEVQQIQWQQTFPPQHSYTVTLEAGEIADDLDFGNLRIPMEISGTKWNDLDADGFQDEQEPPIEGWTIYLDLNNSGTLDAGDISTLTDAHGNYTFTDLSSGFYPVREEVSPGWEQTSPQNSGDSFYNVYLEPAESLGGLNFGNWQPSFISGTKWHDLDADGTQDASEPGLEGWTIYLDANNNGQLDEGETSTLTDTEGNYSFKLGGGTYTVAEVQQTGWVATTPPHGSSTVSVASGETIELDFGNYVPRGEIHGSKWNDQDADGEWDDGEPGLEGWTIYLDANNNSKLDDGELSTVTDKDGNYSFTDLAEGNYIVAEEVQPGWEQTSPKGFPNQVTQLTDNEVFDYYPDVSGKNVVWSIGYGNDSEIYLNQGGQVVQLTDNDYYEHRPQISGNNVVWQEYNENDNSDIYLYDGSQTLQLTDNPSYTYGIQIVGNNVAWLQDYYSDSDNYYADIYLYDGSQTIQLTSDSSHPSFPQIYGNKVVWSADDGFDSEIYLYDGTQIVQLTDNNVNDYNPDLEGNTVVWERSDENDNRQIYLNQGGQVVQLTDNPSGAYNPQISEGNVIWQSYDGVDDTELYLYDGSQVVQISNNQSYEYNPEISGNNVLWTQQYYDEDNNNYYSDIYLYNGSQVIQVTDDNYYEYLPQISDGNVVWPSWDGNDYEIYAYGPGNIHQVSVQAGEVVTDINFGNYSENPGSNEPTPGDDILVGTPEPDEISGLGGNDRISGLAQEDTLRGGSGNDTVLGGDGDDYVVGQQDNDVLYGGNGNDGIHANTGDDLAVGGLGNDRVHGGKGMDTLIGVDPDNSQPGVNEIDQLYGVEGADRFVLGDASKVYYNDGQDLTSGWNDYASIEDFVVGENVIQLSGKKSDYVLAASPTGLPTGTAIFLETGTTDELIGIVRNVPVEQLDLAGSSFSYV